MNDELVFFTNPMSRGRIARWMLEEVGAPYRTEILDYGATGLKSAAYLAVNPMGKVPAITHRGNVVTEGAAICAYLADTFPAARLAPPPGDAARAPYFRWLFFAAGPVEAAITNRTFNLVPPAEKKAAIGYGSYEEVVDTLEGAVKTGPYLCGEQFTAADVYVGSQIGFGMRFKTIEARPAFVAYWDRLASRPAMTRGNQIDDAAMAAMKKA
jgi:glutathione S-transferase